MNINSSAPPEGQGLNRIAQPTQNTSKPANVESTDNTTAAKNTNPTDRVDISSRSKEISDIMSAINQLPDVRTDKVQQVQQSVEAGTYSIDSRKVADKILENI
jgi:negative regulator of flagellin synthesis FlgM